MSPGVDIACAEPAFLDLTMTGLEAIPGTPAQMAARIKDETEKFARLVKDAKVTIE